MKTFFVSTFIIKCANVVAHFIIAHFMLANYSNFRTTVIIATLYECIDNVYVISHAVGVRDRLRKKNTTILNPILRVY